MEHSKTNIKTELIAGITTFLALLLIPPTYSITQGIVWRFLSWSTIKIVTGKIKEISLILWFINLFAILSLIYH